MTARKQGHAPAKKHSSTRADTKKPAPANTGSTRYLIVAALVVAAVLGGYSVSRAGNGGATSTPVASTAATGNASAPAVATPGAPTGSDPSDPSDPAGAVTTTGGVQKAAVKVGFDYQPGVIRLKAGVPAEITFSQAQGCTAQVQSQSLGFQEDLSTGAKTVKLEGLKPGTYEFACGMNMVRGQIVVS